jgi:bifunctional polynucleotide phosphatase/kinase
MIIEETESYIIINNGENNKNKSLCLFDLDGTLIKFNLNSDNYILQYDNVITKLIEINRDNNIIIITNQKQLNNNKKYILFMNKINKLITELRKNNIFIEIYISIKNDKYRKPNIGFIDIIKTKYNKDIKYYCGDALGRENDFNDTDLKFALNLDIDIYSPEQIFLDKPIDNKIIKYPILNKKKYNFRYEPKQKEMIIMIGFPGSGKSTIAKMIQEYGYINNLYYNIISRDKLKTIKKCIINTKDCIKNNYNIIIDNTNPDKKSRKIFVDIGIENKYKIIYIILETSEKISKHNNYYRHIKYGKELIPDIVYNIFKSKYEEPNKNEKYDKIIRTGVNIYDYEYHKYYY